MSLGIYLTYLVRSYIYWYISNLKFCMAQPFVTNVGLCVGSTDNIGLDNRPMRAIFYE